MKIVYRVVTKQGSEGEFKNLAEEVLAPEALAAKGCHFFKLFQNAADSGEFILYEEWDNEQNVHEYKQKLIAILGKPNPGEEFPAKMNDMIAEDEDLA